jgi:hypothetical protein
VREPERRSDEGRLANLALVLGVVVALTTAATQTRRFGRAVGDVFGGDLLNVAFFGLAAAAGSLVALALAPPGARGRCVVGLALSLTPVALLAYYLSTTAG